MHGLCGHSMVKYMLSNALLASRRFLGGVGGINKMCVVCP